MMFLKLKSGRTCEVVEIHYGDDLREVEIIGAFYCDVEGEGPEAELSESDLRELNEVHYGRLYELAMDRYVSHAEALAEGDR